MTLALRSELVVTAKRMSALGLTPGMSGNVSVRSERGLLVTPSGMPYDELVADDAVQLAADGSARPGQRAPTTEWRLHRDILAARTDVNAIVHTHSLFCTALSMLRRPLPAAGTSAQLMAWRRRRSQAAMQARRTWAPQARPTSSRRRSYRSWSRRRRPSARSYRPARTAR